jgi:putative transposase
MRLTEQHIIRNNNKYYKELLHICHLSKNLYNATLYAVRQYFFDTRDNEGRGKYLNYANVDKMFKSENNADYRALPIQTSQQTMRMVDSNFKSFFRSIKKGIKSARIPRYLDKEGYYITIYTSQQLGKRLKTGIIHLPFTNIEFRTKKTNVKQVRFIPRIDYIIMEVIYDVEDVKQKQDNKRYISIDLGLNNLATVTSNVLKPFIINGRPLKSINQYYNKYKAHLQSISGTVKTHRIRRMTLKRRNKIMDYFHKSTTHIVNQAVSNAINTIIVGYNTGWKQDINMGTRNNQSFVSIPHSMFLSMLEYKCSLHGIRFIKREEAYTSKASFIDCDPIEKQDTFSGERVCRGLYRSKLGKLINADVNGSLNIIRKEVRDVVIPTDRGFVFNPYILSF